MLFALVQICENNITSIAQHPKLEADSRNAHLDDAVVVVCLVVLVLPRALDVGDGRVCVFLELLRVFLDDGEVCLQRRQTIVAELVGAG